MRCVEEVSKVADQYCALSTSELLSLGHGEQTAFNLAWSRMSGEVSTVSKT